MLREADDSVKDAYLYRLVFGLALLLGFVVLALLAHGPDTLPGDVRILEWVQSLDWPGVEPIVQTTNWAMSGRPLSVIALVLLIVVGLRGHFADSAVIGIATACRLLNPVLKDVVQSPRPDREFWQSGVVPTGLGFPSGHTSGAVLVVGAAAWVLSQRVSSTGMRWAVWFVAGLVILTTGFGRIWVGAHWPSDVLGGFLWSLPVLIAIATASHWNKTRKAVGADASRESSDL